MLRVPAHPSASPTERSLSLPQSLLAFVVSHGFEASLDGDQVLFLIPCSLNGELCAIGAWERVSTFREARNALGY
jgi:hypothetical protein